jgi:hypothetical protein
MNLIYDRTAADVAEAKRIRAKVQAGEPLTADEQTAYFAGLRGSYNTSDQNRVEAAVVELSVTLNSYGYPNITVPHTWVSGENTTAAQWAQYLANVQALVDAFYTLPDAPALPAASDRLTRTGMNAIERLLADIDILIDWMEHSFRPCGSFACGSNAMHLPLKGV